MANDNFSCDVCIFCALEEEARAFIKIISEQCEVSFKQAFSKRINHTYLSTTLQNNQGEPLTIHVSWPPHYGPIDTSLHLGLILDEFRPRFVAMTGICAGDKKKVKLGDIIVAERAFNYEAGKYANDENDNVVQSHDTTTYYPDQGVLQFIRMFDSWKPLVSQISRPQSKRQQREWLLSRLYDTTTPRFQDIPQAEREQHAPAWRSFLSELQQGPASFLTPERALRDPEAIKELSYGSEVFPYQDPPRCERYIAAMASGSGVRSDNPFLKVQQPVRTALAIDMEGAAFYRTLAFFPFIRSLLVKGVCDYADKEKDDTYHDYAALASAAYILCFIQAYVTNDLMPHHAANPTNVVQNVTTSTPEEKDTYRTQFENVVQSGPTHWLSSMPREQIYIEPNLYWKQETEEQFSPLFREDKGKKLAIANVLEELQQEKRLLIVSSFNMGKTRLLEHICEEYLQRYKENTASSQPLPLLVPLQFYRDEKMPFLTYLQRFLSVTYGTISSGGALLPTGEILQTGAYLFLLDGFDELGSAQQTILLQIRAFISQYPQHWYILSGRPSVYGATEAIFTGMEFQALTIAPFEEKQIRLYLQERRLRHTPLEKALQEQRDLLSIARTPGNLKLLCDAGGLDGDIPPQLSLTYERLIQGKMEREIRRRTAVIDKGGLSRSLLNRIALEMMQRQISSLPESELEQLIQHLVAEEFDESYSIKDWIHEIRYRQIFVSQGNEVAFESRSWQEYLAACALVSKPLEEILALVYVERKAAAGFHPLWYPVLSFLVEMRDELDVLSSLYEKEPIIGARCTPFSAPNAVRLQALQILFTEAHRQKRPLLGSFDTSRDFLNERQTCLRFESSEAVSYLRSLFDNDHTTTIVREDALELLIEYAANDNTDASDVVVDLVPLLLRDNADEIAWGLRESAAYAVSRLGLRQYVPDLISLYQVEQQKFVSRAIQWSLALIGFPEARDIFLEILIQSLKAPFSDSVSSSAVDEALPRLLDDSGCQKIRDELRHLIHDSVMLPTRLIEFLIQKPSLSCCKTLLVIAIHLQLMNTSSDSFAEICAGLSRYRTPMIKYLIEQAAEPYVGHRQAAQVLATLLDGPTFESCKRELSLPTIPMSIINITYFLLQNQGKDALARELASIRGDVIPPAMPQVPQFQIATRTDETLGFLLSQEGWEDGKAFTLQAEAYAKQLHTASSDQLKQMQQYIIGELEKLDTNQAFHYVEDEKGGRASFSIHAVACLTYGSVLKMPISPFVYKKIVSIDFQHPCISAFCENQYTPDVDQDLIEQLHPGAPLICLVRVAELCRKHLVRPVISALGNVIVSLCSEDQRRSLDDHHILRLISILSEYGSDGAKKMVSLFKKVHPYWAVHLAIRRLYFTFPNAEAEKIYLESLLTQIQAGEMGLWDREIERIQTAEAVPYLFALLPLLLKELARVDSSQRDTAIKNVSIPTTLIGPPAAELKLSLVLTGALNALTRIAALGNDGVIYGYQDLLKKFPENALLYRFFDDARRVYLAAP